MPTVSHCKFYGKSAERLAFRLPILAVCLSACLSCSTNFQVNAPYKQENEVYGLLELHDNQQIIKIGKVFQNGPGVSASQAAQQMDSLYQTDSLDVRLTEYNRNGSQTNQVHLYKFYNTQKDPGIFASPGQYLYATAPGLVLNTNDTYILTIYDPKTKVTSQGQTVVVGDVQEVHPYPGSEANFTDQAGIYYAINFGVGANAITYDVNINIPVEEYKTSDSSLIRTDTLVYNFQTGYNVVGLTGFKQDFESVRFYQFVGGSLTVDKNIYRKMDSLDFEYTGAGQDLVNYIQVNTPSTGIVQKKPDYTNITNGVGIFSSRLITHIKMPLTSTAYGLLNSSQYTQGLNFVK